MPVLLRCEGLLVRSVNPTQLRESGERMLFKLGLADRELSILLTNDRSMQVLNAEHRRKNKPTDVLAFPMSDGEELGFLLGDVVISLDTARRQAKKASRPIIHEVTMLLAHGLLHLVGYDHRTRAETERMEAKVRELVSAARGKDVDNPEKTT